MIVSDRDVADATQRFETLCASSLDDAEAYLDWLENANPRLLSRVQATLAGRTAMTKTGVVDGEGEAPRDKEKAAADREGPNDLLSRMSRTVPETKTSPAPEPKPAS